MPLLGLSVAAEPPGTGPVRLHATDGTAMAPALKAALAASTGPVTVMVHGYRFAPGHPRHCPHRTLFAPPGDRGHRPGVSWPRHLGAQRAGAGLTIALGWPARGTPAAAYARAAAAGAALAGLCAAIRSLAPGRPLHAIGHSLGARVILQALAAAPEPFLDWAILLAPAEFRAAAADAIASPAGRAAQSLAVTSGENALFERLLECAVPPARAGDRALGTARIAPPMIELRIDHAPTLAALAAAGHRLAPPRTRICHWSPYLRPGAFPLYRALLSGRLAAPRLRALLATADTAARTPPAVLPRPAAPDLPHPVLRHTRPTV